MGHGDMLMVGGFSEWARHDMASDSRFPKTVFLGKRYVKIAYVISIKLYGYWRKVREVGAIALTFERYGLISSPPRRV